MSKKSAGPKRASLRPAPSQKPAPAKKRHNTLCRLTQNVSTESESDSELSRTSNNEQSPENPSNNTNRASKKVSTNSGKFQGGKSGTFADSVANNQGLDLADSMDVDGDVDLEILNNEDFDGGAADSNGNNGRRREHGGREPNSQSSELPAPVSEDMAELLRTIVRFSPTRNQALEAAQAVSNQQAENIQGRYNRTMEAQNNLGLSIRQAATVVGDEDLAANCLTFLRVIDQRMEKLFKSTRKLVDKTNVAVSANHVADFGRASIRPFGTRNYSRRAIRGGYSGIRTSQTAKKSGEYARYSARAVTSMPNYRGNDRNVQDPNDPFRNRSRSRGDQNRNYPVNGNNSNGNPGPSGNKANGNNGPRGNNPNGNDGGYDGQGHGNGDQQNGNDNGGHGGGGQGNNRNDPNGGPNGNNGGNGGGNGPPDRNVDNGGGNRYGNPDNVRLFF